MTEKLLEDKACLRQTHKMKLEAHPREAAMSKESNRGSESCSIQTRTQMLVDVKTSPQKAPRVKNGKVILQPMCLPCKPEDLSAAHRIMASPFDPCARGWRLARPPV